MGIFAGVELNELVLRGPRLTLRPWRVDDAPAVLAVMRDRRMREFLAVPDPYTAEDAARFVGEIAPAERATGTGFDSAVIETDTERLVGSAALRRLDQDPEIGYWITPEAQGRGYAAEAARTLAAWAFERQVRRVQVHCDVRNLASAGSALAAGFRYEGTYRGYPLRPLDGTAQPRVCDLAWFGRLASDPGEAVQPAFVRFPRAGLEDGTVLLRALVPEDTAGFLAQETDPLTVANGFTGVAPTPEQARRACARAGLDWLVGRVAAFAMIDLASRAFAGSVRLRQAGPPGVGGIGYAVHPRFRGRSYAARALRLLVPWAFAEGGFARLELGAKTANVASQRAALAAGFDPDGVRATRLRNPDGSYSDEVRFALVNRSI